MNLLAKAAHQEEEIDYLIELTSIRSEKAIRMIKYHLVNGYSKEMIDREFGFSVSNMNRSLKTLNEVAAITEKLIELRISKVRGCKQVQ